MSVKKTMAYSSNQNLCLGDVGHNQQVFFCSNFYDQQDCWVWDGYTQQGFTKIASTFGSHYAGGLQRFNDTVVVWSGEFDSNGTTEMLINSQWQQVNFSPAIEPKVPSRFKAVIHGTKTDDTFQQFTSVKKFFNLAGMSIQPRKMRCTTLMGLLGSKTEWRSCLHGGLGIDQL